MKQTKKAAPPAYVTLPTAADEKDESGRHKPSEDSVARLRDFGEDNKK